LKKVLVKSKTYFVIKERYTKTKSLRYTYKQDFTNDIPKRRKIAYNDISESSNSKETEDTETIPHVQKIMEKTILKVPTTPTMKKTTLKTTTTPMMMKKKTIQKIMTTPTMNNKKKTILKRVIIPMMKKKKTTIPKKKIVTIQTMKVMKVGKNMINKK